MAMGCSQMYGTIAFLNYFTLNHIIRFICVVTLPMLLYSNLFYTSAPRSSRIQADQNELQCELADIHPMYVYTYICMYAHIIEEFSYLNFTDNLCRMKLLFNCKYVCQVVNFHVQNFNQSSTKP